MSTPVQRQYAELKAQNPQAILFFRLGDFYEMFYEDAQLASRILGIVLTARHKGTENEMPMCGFPHHAHEEYLSKLIEAGYAVAIAEQREDPATAKITREVVRVVTPGTTLEKGNLIPEENSFLVALDLDKENFALSYADLSTGSFKTSLFTNELSFFDELYKLNPREILLSSDTFVDKDFCRKLPQAHLTVRKRLDKNTAEEIIRSHFDLQNLAVLGLDNNLPLTQTVSQILAYLKETQKTDLSHLSKLVRYDTREVMQLDKQTFQHLEIFRPFQTSDAGATLYSVFEKSLTAMGARLFRSWLSSPLLDKKKINFRLEAVEEILNNLDFQKNLTKNLQQIADLERIKARLVTGRGNARDLAFLRNSLAVLPDLVKSCENMKANLVQSKSRYLNTLNHLSAKLEKALVENPPLEIMSGGMFKDGFSKELDELRLLSQDSKTWLDDFLEKQKKESGIQNLRLKFSNNFGFCLEVSTAQAKNVPGNWIRRQTLVNAERFTTNELSNHEEKVLSSESKAFELEHKLFLELRAEVLKFSGQIQEVSTAIAELDAIFVLTRTASKGRWTKPEITTEDSILEIEKGRHPVVEKLATETFIANDLRMSEDSRFHLLTGPNMAGKSTFLRQNAILILLAQIGSFVPAKKMKTSIFDRIFTRVGASDDLAGGKSTFFVEMTETSRILYASTEKSFVILDEIGRGTSTFDGISLAWAITEHLHNEIKAKTLFATHFHELVELVEELPQAQNFHVSATLGDGGITFLRRVIKGGIADSFGIDVAESAGVPKKVIENSRKVLKRLESENLLSGKPNLFSTVRQQEKIVLEQSKTDELLQSLNPEELTPREALEAIFQLKKKG